MNLHLPPPALPAPAGAPDSRRLRAGLAATLASLATAFAASMPLPAQGKEGFAGGHAVFEKAGCSACHLFASRRLAPSIRDMMRDFAEDPLAVAAATRASRAHQLDMRFSSLSEDDLRSIAQWLGAAAWPEADVDEAAAESETPGEAAPEGATSVLATPPDLPAAAPTAVAVTPALATTTPALAAAAPAGPLPRVAVSAIRIEKGKPRSDRLIVDLSGGEPEMVDIQLLDDKLLVVFSGTRLGAVVPLRRADWPGSSVVGAVNAVDRGGSVELAVEAKVAAWTYSGTQGKRRLVIDFTAAATQPAARSAPAVEVAQAVAPTATPPAATATTPTAKATLAPAAKPVPAPAKPSTPPPAKAAVPPVAKKAVAPIPKTATSPAPTAPSAAKPLAAATANAPPVVAPAAPVAATAPVAAAVAAASAATAAAPASPAVSVTEPAKKVEPSAPKLALAAPAAALPAKAKAAKGKADADLEPCPPATPEEQVIGQFDPRAVKEILDRIGCPQCHAHAQKKTGSPFRDITKKYKGDPACVVFRLKTNQTHKDEGVVRDTKPEEYKLIADYVATRVK